MKGRSECKKLFMVDDCIPLVEAIEEDLFVGQESNFAAAMERTEIVAKFQEFLQVVGAEDEVVVLLDASMPAPRDTIPFERGSGKNC